MMRTLTEFQDAVDRETGWRRQELTTILFEVQSARIAKQPTAIRAAVALLYAHWEGWVKRLAEIYIEFVENQRLKYEELSPAFFALAMQVKLNELSASGASAAHVSFAKFLRADLERRARFGGRRSVDTKSNLSSSVLSRILIAIGLEDTWERQKGFANLIDRQLLRQRNKIAHGEYLEVGVPEFESLHRNVTKILDDLTGDVLNCAARRSYRS
jgi:hypothetical protein